MVKVRVDLRQFKKVDQRQFKGELLPMDVCKVDAELGWRKKSLTFRDVNNARVYVECLLGKDKWKWKSSTQIVAKAADTLRISCLRLEEIMESTGKGVLQDYDKENVQRFLYGVWKDEPERKKLRGPEEEVDDKPKVEKKVVNGEAVDLASICARHGWDTRRARQGLRKLGVQREGRWAWPVEEVAGIEEKLGKIFG
jgi:hypothetical protein